MTVWVNEPYVLTGLTGSAEIPSGSDTVIAGFTGPFAGLLTLHVDGLDNVLFEVYDTDGDMIQDDNQGDLGLVLQNATQVQIKITSGNFVNAPATLHWTYAERPSSTLQVVLGNTEVAITPGAMLVNLGNGAPSDEVTFSFLGPTEVLHFTSITLDQAGMYSELAIPLPSLQAGDYVLRAETIRSGSSDSDFTVIEDPLDSDTHVTVDPVPPALVVQRWTFYDARNPDETWTLQRNPKSWSNMLPPNNFTEVSTVAPDGNTLTYEAGSRPWRMEFTGFIDNEDEYNRFVFWSQKRRRLWLIDHRNRSWLLTIEDFDARALIKPGLPWAHDYTAKTVIFKQGTD